MRSPSDIARAALLEVTAPATVGTVASETDDGEGVITVRFWAHLDGYPGWLWTVSLARVGDAEPTVLESELLPGDGALLAPEWVPWVDRLEEWRAAQEGASASPEDDEDADDDALDDEDDEDEVDGDADDIDLDDLADDLGDDRYDGVDIDSAVELALPEMGVEQAGPAEPDPDQHGHQQPVRPARRRAQQRQGQNDQQGD